MELQSTVRTQSRDAVSQGQDRIREAVNRNKKAKLTSLLHHVGIDVLRWAFFSLKKRAAPACGTKKDGKTFQLWRRSQRKRFRAKLKDVEVALRRRSHLPIAEQGAWLEKVVRGYFAYHAVPTNFKALCDFRRYAVWHWYRALRRRSQRWRRTWQWMKALANRYLPSVRIMHPWPEQRFRVQHSR
ncbi:MAG: hypothetical protein ACYCT1_13340 [Steroidobacteraceae bacterium]